MGDTKNENRQRLLEKSRHGYDIGKHISDVTLADLKANGHTKKPLIKVIRERCLDCCGFQAGEVRKCVDVKCPSWPYRMGSNPFYGEGE